MACCQACLEHTKKPGQAGDCNSWVFCPEEVCWSPDIWNHTFGECWLKVQQDVNNPQVLPAQLVRVRCSQYSTF